MLCRRLVSVLHMELAYLLLVKCSRQGSMLHAQAEVRLTFTVCMLLRGRAQSAMHVLSDEEEDWHLSSSASKVVPAGPDSLPALSAEAQLGDAHPHQPLVAQHAAESDISRQPDFLLPWEEGYVPATAGQSPSSLPAHNSEERQQELRQDPVRQGVPAGQDCGHDVPDHISSAGHEGSTRPGPINQLGTTASKLDHGPALQLQGDASLVPPQSPTDDGDCQPAVSIQAGLRNAPLHEMHGSRTPQRGRITSLTASTDLFDMWN